MKHLKKFKTTAEFEAAKEMLSKPWVTMTIDNSSVHYMNDEDKPEEDLSKIIHMINGNEEGVSTTYTNVEEIINSING